MLNNIVLKTDVFRRIAARLIFGATALGCLDGINASKSRWAYYKNWAESEGIDIDTMLANGPPDQEMLFGTLMLVSIGLAVMPYGNMAKSGTCNDR